MTKERKTMGDFIKRFHKEINHTGFKIRKAILLLDKVYENKKILDIFDKDTLLYELKELKREMTELRKTIKKVEKIKGVE